ncbi:MAG: hypothetical protein FGM55_13620 [Rhodoferax sp.]|nr:hypothetical protein [Rhodoferax sp.]
MTAQLRIKRTAVRSLATVLLTGVTGCTIVDLKVQGPSALRAKSREVVQENGNGRAALLLQKATQSSADEATRIAAQAWQPWRSYAVVRAWARAASPTPSANPCRP